MKTGTYQIKLSDKEVADQKKYADKYFQLIQKELAYGDLCDAENVANYTKSYIAHMELHKNGYVQMIIPE